MRKYLFNPGVLTAVLGGIGAVRQTAKGPRDWRLALIWVSWGIGIVVAVGAVSQQEDSVRQQEVERKLRKAAKRR